jgi:hypothetical protein
MQTKSESVEPSPNLNLRLNDSAVTTIDQENANGLITGFAYLRVFYQNLDFMAFREFLLQNH